MLAHPRKIRIANDFQLSAITPKELWPNPSLEPTRYGRQRKAGLRYPVYCLNPALRRLPTRAAQLKR